MKIHIFGASGSGVTTLGRALAAELNYPYFDNDDYFWERSNPPFTTKRDPVKRNEMLKRDLLLRDSWVLGGSMVSWGDEWPTYFDLAIYLQLPPDIRMQRLRQREFERYGDVIFTDPDRHEQYQAFLAWASGYDDNTTKKSSGVGLGRTRQVHFDWSKTLTCPLLQITGTHTVTERVQIVTDFLKRK